MNQQQVAAAANLIFKRPLVRAEIERLLAAEQQARADAYKDQIAEELSRWSRDDSIDHLKRIVAASMNAMETPVRGDSGETVGYDFDPAAARVAKETIDSLNKMQGYNEPEKSEVDAKIRVEFAPVGEDYSG